MFKNPHPHVHFLTASELANNEDGNKGTVLDALTDTEWAAVQEIVNHPQVERVTVAKDPEGFVVVARQDKDDADEMPYEHLFVDKRGRVAAASLNQPVYHRTFGEMVDDTRRRVS